MPRQLRSSFYKSFTAGSFDDVLISLNLKNGFAIVIDNSLKSNKYENAKESGKSTKSDPCNKEKVKTSLMVLKKRSQNFKLYYAKGLSCRGNVRNV